MDETELVDQAYLPLAEVEELFAAKQVEEKAGAAGAAAEHKKHQATVLISAKREQNISIFLRTMKRENDEIHDAILEMDEELLAASVLPMMIESLPTEEETTILTGWQKTNTDVESLDKAERFFVAIQNISHLPLRLKTLQFKLTFPERFGDLRPKVLKVTPSLRGAAAAAALTPRCTQVASAIKDVNTSKRFPKFIKIVLALGNFMNGRNARGGAYGFKLSTLTKLGDTKTTDNKKTLLTWLVEMLEKKDPDMLKLTEDLVATSGAGAVPFQALGADVAQIKQGVTSMQSALETVPRAGDHLLSVWLPR